MGEDCPHCVFEKTEANCPGCFEGSHYRPKPITNYDHLGAESVEEMAEWISSTLYDNGESIDMLGNTSTMDWLDWLKQEASE